LRSPKELAEFFGSRTSGYQVLDAPESEFEVELTTASIGGSSVTSLRSTVTIETDFAAQGNLYSVGIVESGRSKAWVGDAENSHHVGECVITSPGLEIRQRVEPLLATTVQVNGLLLEYELARREAPIAGNPFYLKVDGVEAEALMQLISCLVASVREGTEGLFTGSAATYMEEALVLATVDSIVGRGSVPESLRARAHRPYVLKAQLWMESNLSKPVRIEDIAAHVDVSVRGLQQAFRETIGTTPMSYLDVRRYFRLREHLQQGDRESTVASAGADCGLMHQGRLAKKYFEMFGEHPSEVLKRAKLRQGLT
jgi:AraC-like DNA-binding protein